MPQPDNINCIIIEDELPASDILELYIAKIAFLQLKGTFSSVSKAIPTITSEKIDLMLLDIDLPGIPGHQFAKTLSASTGVIFTTAYSEYAVQGFELNAVDYILKPVSFDRFTKAVNRYLKFHRQSDALIKTADKIIERPFVFIKSDRKMAKIFLDEILYLEAQRNYLLVYVIDKVYRTYQSISEMEDKLPEELFIRIHRSFIIALNMVKAFNSSHVVIQQQDIPIGRVYSTSVEGILKSIVK